jgi:hypothetical protein
MRLVKVLRFLVLLPILLFLACDEFLLKRTVSVQSVRGDISYNPETPSLTGNLTYSIQNRQPNVLTEIYLVSHPAVSINMITYNRSVMRFDVGMGYGYGIYRVRIPRLASGEQSSITIKFSLNGKMESDRFLITEDMVFLDARKIWLPIPFADMPNFHYTINIETPAEYYPILGAKMTKETVRGNVRLSTWQSETDNVRLSGNLFIAKFNRYQKDNIFFYSKSTNNIEKIFDYALFSISNIRKSAGVFPFTQTHLINTLFQYKDMEEFIDAEYIANAIHISPEIFSATNLKPEREVINSAIPFFPNENELNLLSILSHELAHSVTPELVDFESAAHIVMEAFTEYNKCKIMEKRHHSLYPKLIQRNRIILINSLLRNEPPSRLREYFYGVNVFSAAFHNTDDLFFDFLQILIEKYRYTKIGLNEIIVTANEMNKMIINSYMTNLNDEDNGENDLPDLYDKLIYSEAFHLWNLQKLFNISLSSSNVTVTNFIERPRGNPRRVLERKKLITIENEFPVKVDGYLIYHTPANVTSNRIEVSEQSKTNFLLNNDVGFVKYETRFSVLERNLSDNYIDFDFHRKEYRNLNTAINRYYTRDGVIHPMMEIETTSERETNDSKPRSQWIKLDFHRKEIFETRSSNVSFVFDRIETNDNEIFIQAFKKIEKKPVSYVIFKGEKKDNDRYKISGVIDPNINW